MSIHRRINSKGKRITFLDELIDLLDKYNVIEMYPCDKEIVLTSNDTTFVIKNISQDACGSYVVNYVQKTTYVLKEGVMFDD